MSYAESETLCYFLDMAKKGNVLVVDDEEVMRDVLESLLSQDGYRVDLAKTGEEGLARFGERTVVELTADRKSVV